MQQGAYAARNALADAGAEWKDMQFGYGGSYSSGNAEALANERGLTGVPFTNIHNACATGGSSLLSACREIQSGAADIGLVVGFDKHDRGAFNASPSEYGLGDWYGEAGFMLTTQFFAAKIQKYMHDHGITSDALARVAEKAYRNGALNPNACRRTPIALEEIKNSTMVNDPLTKYMFCSPSKVAWHWSFAGKTSRQVHGHAGVRGSGGHADAALRCVRGTHVRGSDNVRTRRNSFESRRARRHGSKDIDVAALQDTEAGADHAHGGKWLLRTASRKRARSGATGIVRRLPVNTDGGCLATASRSGPGLRQIHEVVLQLRGQADAPGAGNRNRVHPCLRGAGISAVTILQKRRNHPR
jgi:acetyl-CoA acetyltransferase